MFLRFRGGGVGHKTTREETGCLLNDRDDLDKMPLILESEKSRNQMDLDDESDEDGDSEETTKDKSEDSDEHEDEVEDEESTRGSDLDESDVGISSAALASKELADEMDEFGYSGLDQVIEEPVEEELLVEEDGLGAEDGENVGDNEDEDEFYADL